jgi:hypothetical protein
LRLRLALAGLGVVRVVMTIVPFAGVKVALTNHLHTCG